MKRPLLERWAPSSHATQASSAAAASHPLDRTSASAMHSAIDVSSCGGGGRAARLGLAFTAVLQGAHGACTTVLACRGDVTFRERRGSSSLRRYRPLARQQ
eukprot:6200076-Prymnesium_polylepis.1